MRAVVAAYNGRDNLMPALGADLGDTRGIHVLIVDASCLMDRGLGGSGSSNAREGPKPRR
jgi:hypothetical protein